MLPCLLCGVLDAVSLTRIKPSFTLRAVEPLYPRVLFLLEDISPWPNQPSSWWFQSQHGVQCAFLSLGVVSLLQGDGKEWPC